MTANTCPCVQKQSQGMKLLFCPRPQLIPARWRLRHNQHGDVGAGQNLVPLRCGYPGGEGSSLVPPLLPPFRPPVQFHQEVQHMAGNIHSEQGIGNNGDGSLLCPDAGWRHSDPKPQPAQVPLELQLLEMDRSSTSGESLGSDQHVNNRQGVRHEPGVACCLGEF